MMHERPFSYELKGGLGKSSGAKNVSFTKKSKGVQKAEEKQRVAYFSNSPQYHTQFVPRSDLGSNDGRVLLFDSSSRSFPSETVFSTAERSQQEERQHYAPIGQGFNTMSFVGSDVYEAPFHSQQQASFPALSQSQRSVENQVDASISFDEQGATKESMKANETDVGRNQVLLRGLPTSGPTYFAKDSIKRLQSHETRERISGVSIHQPPHPEPQVPVIRNENVGNPPSDWYDSSTVGSKIPVPAPNAMQPMTAAKVAQPVSTQNIAQTVGNVAPVKDATSLVKREVSEAVLSSTTSEVGNAAKCRRYREKRKREKDELATKTAILMEERAILLERIAALQQELQVLRSGGGTNLELENQLLRREVSRHRMLVQSLVSLEDTSTEERFRTLTRSLESAVGQVLGLCYTCPSWNLGQPFLLDGQPMVFRYQFLPDGVPPEEAHRLNISVLASSVPLDAKTFDVAGHSIFMDVDHINKNFELVDQQEHYRKAESISLVDMFEQLSLREEELPFELLRMFKVKDTRKPEQQLVYIAGSKSIDLYPHLISGQPQAQPEKATDGREGEGALPPKMVKGYVSVQTTTHQNPLSEESAAEQPAMILGHVTWDTSRDPPRCNAMLIGSFPVANQAYRDISGRAMPSVSADGKISEGFRRELESHFRLQISRRMSQDNGIE